MPRLATPTPESSRGLVGNHELRAGGDYQGDDTRGSSYCNDRGTYRTSIQGVHAERGTSAFCDLVKAPLCTPRRRATRRRCSTSKLVFTANKTESLTPTSGSHPSTWPTKRWSAFPSGRVGASGPLETLTANLGIRYDSESREAAENGAARLQSDGSNGRPESGLAWDVGGDGTSKLYASAGRFYYSLPTDLGGPRLHDVHVRQHVQLQSDGSSSRAPGLDRAASIGSYRSAVLRRRARRTPGSRPSTRTSSRSASRRSLDTTLSVGLEGNIPDARPHDRGPLRPRLHDTSPQNSSCALAQSGQPRAGRPRAAIPMCDAIRQPGRSERQGECGLDRAFRCRRREAHLPRHRAHGAQAVLQCASGHRLSYLVLDRSRATTPAPIREASGQTDPGINADFDYYQLAHQCVRQARARPSAARPGIDARLQRALRARRSDCSSTSAPDTPYTSGGYLQPVLQPGALSRSRAARAGRDADRLPR